MSTIKGYAHLDSTTGKLLASEAPAGGSGAMTLIETITIAVAVQNVDFIATLDGDNDGSYRMVGHLISDSNAGGFITCTLRVNGVNPGTVIGSLIYQDFTAAGTAIGTIISTAALGSVVATTGRFMDFIMEFPNPESAFSSRWYSLISAERTTLYDQRFSISFATPSAKITSLGIGSDKANGIGIGSKFSLYKIAK